jgi:aspartyl-tRNA(Asn)/glutamyl-tRNA(Gln) amidotransferase subunit B
MEDWASSMRSSQGDDDNPETSTHPRRQCEGDGRARRPIMRETKGRADGGEVNRLLREKLGV